MLTASGSPLVGGTSNAMDIKTVSVKVLRPFLLKLDRQEAGKVISIPRFLANELASANKVEILKPTPAPAEVKPEPVKVGKKGD